MTMRRSVLKVGFGIVLGTSILLAAGNTALADKDYNPACRDRLNGDKARIDRDAKRFGETSKQVDRDRDKMDADRKWCRDHKADWDHNIFDLDIYIKK